MKFEDLVIKKMEQITTDTKDGTTTKYKIVFEAEDATISVTSNEELDGFVVGNKVSVSVSNPQTSLKKIASSTDEDGEEDDEN